MEKQSGIGGAQVWALSLVAQHQGLGVTKLAELMDIHQSTTSNLVRSLIKSGLLHSENPTPGVARSLNNLHLFKCKITQPRATDCPF
jgi:predicted transcriptional regulator